MRKLVFNKYVIGLTFVVGLFLWFSRLPKPLFRVAYATVLQDKNAQLLAASIASDGQWRFPASDSVPAKFETAILQFEDAHFYYHFGVNPVSIIKAGIQNYKSGKVVRGGSTLTMQVIRLANKNPPRTYWQKAKEVLQAIRLEMTYSKEDILKLYCAHAPFGGNVVGLETAAWRYYGLAPHKLSWAEVATLAVLPNRPGLIYPGKAQTALLSKRNRLLKKLYAEGYLDTLQLQLAYQETLPQSPHPVPQTAPHLLQFAKSRGMIGQRIKSTINKNIQTKVNQILRLQRNRLEANKIHNAAILVLDNYTGEVMAYGGNIPDSKRKVHGLDVDLIQAKRSTGSLLKPFLYGLMLQDGLILPKTLIKDVPIYYDGFFPQNFHKKYEGAVPADRALARSLNVPAVFMLREYQPALFHKKLKSIGMKSLDKAPSHYGLALILGGAEGTLWQLTGMYASLSRSLNNYWTRFPDRYAQEDIREAHFIDQDENKGRSDKGMYLPVYNAASIYYMYEAMSKVYRPSEEVSWELFESSNKIAWKTGTSYGHRDAWAIGTTPEFTVGVWVGNADGEGRPGLTGLDYAAPILFETFKTLPKTSWWNDFPYDETQSTRVCPKSGMLAGPACPSSDTVQVPKNGVRTEICAYHRYVQLNAEETKQVKSNCYPKEKLVSKAMFVLPPVMEWYYKQNHSDYDVVPEWEAACMALNKEKSMQMIYPRHDSEVIIPKLLDGSQGASVFELAHRFPDRKVYWYLDEKLIGYTKNDHKLAVQALPGNHNVYVVDEEGEDLFISFSVLDSKGK